MTTLILGKTLVFWSGIVSGISFLLMIAGCSFVIKLGGRFAEMRMRLHKYSMVATVSLILIHLTLALISSLFGVWL